MKIILHPGDSIVHPPGSVISFSDDCGSAELVNLSNGSTKITAFARKDGETGFSWQSIGAGGLAMGGGGGGSILVEPS